MEKDRTNHWWILSWIILSPINSINDLKAPLRFGMVRWGNSASEKVEETKMLIRRPKDPFAEIEMRLAYYYQIGKDETVLLSGIGDKVIQKSCQIVRLY